MKEEPEIFLHSDIGKSEKWRWSETDPNRLNYENRWADGRKETGSLKVSPIPGIGSLREIEAAHAAELQAFKENMEASAWEIWKHNWSPSIWDRLVIFFHRPTACYQSRLDPQTLCRIRYLEHRQKNPLP